MIFIASGEGGDSYRLPSLRQLYATNGAKMTTISEAMQFVYTFGNSLANDVSDSIDITDVKIGLICNVCGHHWGVRIDKDGNINPLMMVCMPCYNKSIARGNEGNEHHDKYSALQE